jgi:hypothetical protein
MEESKLVEEILEIACELDRGDITFGEAKAEIQNLVRIDRYEQTDLLTRYNGFLNMQYFNLDLDEIDINNFNNFTND